MTQDDKISDIIDIDPEHIIESKSDDSSIPNTTSSRKYGVYGLGVTAVLAGAVAGGWFYRDVLSTYLPSDQFHTMSARLDTIETTNKNIAQKLDAVVGLTDEIKSQLGAAQAAAEDARKQAAGLKIDAGNVNSKLAALDKSLGLANAAVDDLKNKVASGVSNTGSPDVSGLTSRVEKLESGLAALNNRPIAKAKADAAELTLGLTNLSAKIASGASYQDEIQLLSQMVPAAEGLDILNSNAKIGVITKQALAAGLKDFVDKTVSPAPVVEIKDDSWWGRTSAIFSGLITIKSVGEVDWKQVASQAIGLVDNDQTAEAVKLLEQNLDTLPQTLQDWRVNAAKRVAVDQALELVNRAVTREIAARG